MKLIAHRGNLFGPNPILENNPSYLIEAMTAGFDVELDVWLIDNDFYLGHNEPTYPTDIRFLSYSTCWCHAKNLPALVKMLELGIHCFWHQTDDVVLTSQGYLWTFPGKPIASDRAIAVCPERVESWDIDAANGICSDFVANYGP
jgi:hypothetical protein